jgi:tRNA (guanine6-N2)-methyltransferase
LIGKFPDTWKPAEENASIEVWLTIQEGTALCGLRLSDFTMRHRTYKLEHRPASLRPTVAAAMVRLAEVKPGQLVLDPMCGVGTILAEYLVTREGETSVLAAASKPLLGIPPTRFTAWGGDREFAAVRSAAVNLRRLGGGMLACWDATRLPVESAFVDRLISNPPFGKQLSDPEAIKILYQSMVQEYDRIIRPGGRVVLLVSAGEVLRDAVREVGWTSLRQVRLRLLGQTAVISVWQKAPSGSTMA